MAVSIRAPSVEEFFRLVEEHHLDIACRAPTRQEDGSVVLTTEVPETLIPKLRRRKATVEVLYDAGDYAKKRRAEVGKGNRFAERDALPEGVGELIDQEQGHVPEYR